MPSSSKISPSDSPTEHKVVATVATTGEVLEYSYSNGDDLAEAYKDVTAHLAAYRSLKNLLLETSMQLLMFKSKKEKK